MAQLVSTVEPAHAAQIADRLIAQFGSIGQILASSATQLERAVGSRQVADILLLSQQFAHEALREDLRRTHFEIEDPRFARYLVSTMVGAKDERLLAVFLDHQSRFIREETVALGGWNEVSVRLRGLLRRAIEVDCSRLVLSHNHPSGSPHPSDRDIEFTNRLLRDAQPLGIELVDHIIVAGPQVFSMRSAGAMS